MEKSKIKSIIDHTVLKAEATEAQVKKLCSEALENNFAAVCVNPCFVQLSKSILKESSVKVCTVIGFPLGASTPKTKAFETKDAIENGADEVDMVINIGKLKDKDYNYVKEDIKAVVDAAKDKAIVKVILETALLTNEEIEKASILSKEAGADFIKTSTGFSTRGASVEDIIIMRKAVGCDMKIKASGGIKTYEDAKKMIENGADRLGTSSSVEITK